MGSWLCCSLFVIAIGLVIKPQFAFTVHNFTFRTSEDSAVQQEN